MTKKDLIKLIKSYDPHKIVFWIGAGIDNNPPTNLPLAKTLIENILELTCGKLYSQKILEQCKLIYNDIPRMETVISEIKMFEKELAVDSTVISGFQSFLDAPPNSCHQVLAQYLNQGSNIVTFNYGNAISKAFNMQYHNNFPLQPVFNSELNLYLYSDSNITKGKIYHPHGVANDLNTIGISLNEVKNTLSSKFKETLINWLENGYCFIFLGYSCSDTLDINPFFKSLKIKENTNSIGIVINHSLEDSFSNKNENSKIADILTPFNQYFIFNTNTNNFIQNIKIQESCNQKLSKSNEFMWLNNFCHYIKPYNEELNKYISLGIIKSLGLDYKKILPSNWYKQKNYELFNRHWYIDYYYFICLSQSADFGKALRFIKNIRYNNLAKSDMYSKLWFTKKAAKATISIPQANKTLTETNWLSSNKKVDWNISTSLNRNAEWIILDILKNPIFLNVKIKKHFKTAMLIIESNNIIIKLGNDFVLDFVQQLTALRYNGILLMLFENEYDLACNYLNRALYHYDAISSITGVIRCKLYLTIVEMFNFKMNNVTFSLKQAKLLLEDIQSHYQQVINPKDKYLYNILKFYFFITNLHSHNTPDIQGSS